MGWLYDLFWNVLIPNFHVQCGDIKSYQMKWALPRFLIFTFLTSLCAIGVNVDAQELALKPPIAAIEVDLSAVPGDVDFESVQLYFNGEEIGPLNSEGQIDIPITPGPVTFTAIVPKIAAAKVSFKTRDKVTGRHPIRLVLHPMGLMNLYETSLEFEDLRPSYLVATSSPIRLRFVDSEGNIAPVTEVLEASLKPNAYYLEKMPLDSKTLFTVLDDGVIQVRDMDAFQRIFKDLATEDETLKLSIVARDAETELSYRGATEFRLGDAKVSGRRVFTTPPASDVPLGKPLFWIGGVSIDVDENGNFEADGIPSGERDVVAYYSIKHPETGRKIRYRAKRKIPISGEMQIELRMSPKLMDESVIVVSHQPPLNTHTKAQAELVQDLDEPKPPLFIPPEARFKLVNLYTHGAAGGSHEKRSEAEIFCSREDRWTDGDKCMPAVLGDTVIPRQVMASPEDGAELIGNLYDIYSGHDPSIWFVPNGPVRPSSLAPDYILTDSGYQAFGYAVTVHDIKNGKAAIRLPNNGELGWIDISEDLPPKNSVIKDASGVPDDLYNIGFSPIACGYNFAGEQVFLEEFLEDKIRYRLPTPHDEWSVYTHDGERPPLGDYETITIDWRKAYSPEGRLLFVPIAGKEC